MHSLDNIDRELGLLFKQWVTCNVRTMWDPMSGAVISNNKVINAEDLWRKLDNDFRPIIQDMWNDTMYLRSDTFYVDFKITDDFGVYSYRIDVKKTI